MYYTERQEMKNLIHTLNEASDEYYNSGHSIMDDYEYDNLFKELQIMEKRTGVVLSNSPTRKVGASILSEIHKVNITDKPMLSLNKIHSVSEIPFSGEMVASVKCDGLSVRIIYEDGKIIAANTRGNGYEGGDITEHIKQFINIPLEIPTKDKVIVDGEAIIKWSDFDKDAFKNPRNAAAGALNVLDTSIVKNRKLSFIAWDLISDTKDYKDSLSEMQNLGFEVVPHIFPHGLYSFKEEDMLEIMQMAKRYDIPCDGVVIRLNSYEKGESLGKTEHHFNNAVAWKPEKQLYETRLKSIKYTMGRTGVLTPVAVFDPIEIDGTTVFQASLHNYSIMKNIMGDCCFAGQKIKVYKANEIIPQVAEADKRDYGYVIGHGGVTVDGLSGTLLCPCCKSAVDIVKSDTGVENFICSNPACTGKLINRLDHFCGSKGLNILGISRKTLEKLIDWEYIHSFVDIFKLYNYKKDLCQKEGFGEKSVDKILNSIETVAKKVELWQFISAIGIPHIGVGNAKLLAAHFKTWNDFCKAANNNYDFTVLDGFSVVKAEALLDFDYKESILTAPYIWITNSLYGQKKKETGLFGKTFVITGKLSKPRAEIKAMIEAAGGKFTGSVSGKTNYLVNNDSTSQTAKNIKAKELGVSIITEDELMQLF